MKRLKSISWGIIGCGAVTELKSGPAYQLTEGFQVHTVMCRDAAKVQDFAKRHRIPHSTTDARALINDPAIDAVYIATPPDSHKEYALQVAKAGKICCLEKPMAVHYADCVEIEEAFKSKDLDLFVAYYRRSLPRFQQVKRYLEEGLIGELRHVHWQLFKPVHQRDLSGKYQWRTDAKIAPGGYFDDIGSHGIDLICYLLGDIEAASGQAINQQKLYSAYDAVSGVWRHKSGLTGSGVWNFGAAYFEDRVEISGSEGSIEFAISQEAPIIVKRGTEIKELFIENPKPVQLPHVEDMARHLLDEDFEHPSLGRTALHTAWVMDRILGKL